MTKFALAGATLVAAVLMLLILRTYEIKFLFSLALPAAVVAAYLELVAFDHGAARRRSTRPPAH